VGIRTRIGVLRIRARIRIRVRISGLGLCSQGAG